MIDVKSISTHCTRTEFVGTTVLDTIGLVISGIDDTLLKEMNVGMKYHALGLFSSRTGAAGQITAIDDAVKATNTEVLSIEFPRDTKGWGCFRKSETGSHREKLIRFVMESVC